MIATAITAASLMRLFRKLGPAASAKHAAQALAQRNARGVGQDSIGNDARRALREGSENARDGEKNYRRQKEMHTGGHERAGESKDVFAALDPPAGRVVDEADERGEQGFGARGNDEDEHKEGRGQRGE
jgi:hypothetical protein